MSGVPDGTFAQFRKGKEEPPSIICVGCEQRVPLWDEMEQCFASPEIQQRVRDMQEESAIVLSNESKERALVGEVISTVALARNCGKVWACAISPGITCGFSSGDSCCT